MAYYQSRPVGGHRSPPGRRRDNHVEFTRWRTLETKVIGKELDFKLQYHLDYSMAFSETSNDDA